MCAALAVDVPAGTVGTWPGFAGSMNAVSDSVLNTAGVTVRYKRPRLPSPRSDCIDAALALSLIWSSLMLAKDGMPSMRGRVGCGKVSTMDSVSVGMVVLASVRGAVGAFEGLK